MNRQSSIMFYIINLIRFSTSQHFISICYHKYDVPRVLVNNCIFLYFTVLAEMNNRFSEFWLWTDKQSCVKGIFKLFIQASSALAISLSKWSWLSWPQGHPRATKNIRTYSEENSRLQNSQNTHRSEIIL